MSRLNDLIRQLRLKDPALADDLEREVSALSDRRAFGLNFERHTPEAVELPGRRVRRGDKVRVLPPRGKLSTASDERLWQVVSIDQTDPARRTALKSLDNAESRSAAAADLVVVAEFRDPVYPGLVSTGRIDRGKGKPWHAVINAENYYALQTLLFTHRGQVDCIYIDPPYNTGARDWKYNNDYVESDDLYRHSKWLAFMERRLLLARQLLRPNDSVLIVTIDEKEVHRLGLLIEQVFPDGKAQMITIAINHRGVARNREFTRVEEYAFFVFLGAAGPALTNDDLLTQPSENDASEEPVRWERLIKGSNNARRVDRPNLFYPVYVDPIRRAVSAVGDALPIGTPRSEVPVPAGCLAVWPIGMDGSEKRWQISRSTLQDYVQRGIAKVGSYDRKNDRWTILYLNRGQLDRIERGEIEVVGRDANGVLELRTVTRPQRAGVTMWNRLAHNAGYYGSGTLSALVPGRKFPFPKSIYAVEDTLRFALANKPDAIVVDFFSGSGTTTHAVMRLNRQDKGRRQSLIVTNNEVSAEEQASLVRRGLRPGDPEWEALGICRYITIPRLSAAITGLTPDGNPIRGDYKFVDEFPLAEGFEENIEYFDLTYEAPLRVASNREFTRIAPLLWLRAGSRGRRIDDIAKGWDVADTYGVIADFDRTDEFLAALADQADAVFAFVVTDEDWLFESMCRELPERVEPVRLYQAYLRNFEIEPGRGTR